MSRVTYQVAENWMRDYLEPRYPELVAPYREAGRITTTALQSGLLNDTDLQFLLTHVGSSKRVLSDNVGNMLGKLANVFVSVQQALEQMSISGKVSLRTQALASLLHVPPSSLHERMYARALQDKSKNIRMLAAQNSQIQAMAVLLPSLAQAIAQEQDASTRESLQRSHGLLQDGYWQEIDDTGNYWITCCFKGGTASRFYNKEKFETEGKAWIAESAAEWKKHWYPT